MAHKMYEPIVYILPKPTDVDVFIANYVKDQIKRKPACVLSLPTGSTPLGMYKHLVEMYKQKTINFHQVRIFNLDEYWPIKNIDPASYASYMRINLLDHINIKKRNWDIPNGEAPDSEKESKRYELKLKRISKIDLAILGIGPGKTCHIGFNERGSSVDSVVRYIKLDEETKMINKKQFSNPEKMPQGAITQGIADILKAKEIVLVAKGESKAWGIRRTLHGEISSNAPASFLRYHPNVVFVLDHDAAKLLG